MLALKISRPTARLFDCPYQAQLPRNNHDHHPRLVGDKHLVETSNIPQPALRIERQICRHCFSSLERTALNTPVRHISLQMIRTSLNREVREADLKWVAKSNGRRT